MSTTKNIDYVPFHLPKAPALEWEMHYDDPCSFYTHPAQLAAIAQMTGHTPPSIETARILEIGSAVGGNLNVIAATLPNAECIGIDPFEAQVVEARQKAQQSGLNNVSYFPIGVEELSKKYGQFDYIIGHGVFSWINQEARQATLHTCAQALSPNGLGYLSYNTYPRWYVNQLSRSLMRWRIRHLKGNENLAHRARSIIKLFGHQASPLGIINPRAYFKKKSEYLASKPDYYLVHEYLLEQNTPFHFHEFIQLLAGLFNEEDPDQTGLTYLSDASLNTELAHFAFDNKSHIKSIESISPNRLAFEEMLDHLFHRGIRRSIFARSSSTSAQIASSCNLSDESIQHHIGITPHHQNGEVKRSYSFSDFESIWIHSSFEYKDQVQSSNMYSYFQHRHQDLSIETHSTEQSAILLILSASWPHSILVHQCIDYAQEMYSTLTSKVAPSKETFLKALHQCLYFEWIAPPRISSSLVIDKLDQVQYPQIIPTLLGVTPLSLKAPVSNLYHDLVKLSNHLQSLVPHLDGKHTRSQLADLAFPTESKEKAISLVQDALKEAHDKALLYKL